MRRFIPRLLTFFTALLAGFLVVFAINKVAYHYLPAPPIDPISQIDEPAKAAPLPVMDYQPLHWPRIKGARLALTGDWLTDDPATKGYEKWMGYWFDVDNLVWDEIDLKITRFHDEEIDEPGQKSGRRYHLDMTHASPFYGENERKPDFLVKGVPGVDKYVVPKPIFNVLGEDFWDDEIWLGDQGPKWFSLGDQNYSFYAEGSRLLITNGKISQPIFDRAIKETPEWMTFGFPAIVWAGDLDGDRKLDFILHFVHQYEGGSTQRMVLYTSRPAESHELVAPVADFTFNTAC